MSDGQTSPASPEVWFYMRATFFNPVEEGPLTYRQLLQIAKMGEMSLDTKLRSPTRTKNQWIVARNVKDLAILINQADIDSKKKAMIVKEQKLAEKASKQELAIIAKQQAQDLALTEQQARKASEIALQHQQELQRLEIEKEQQKAMIAAQAQVPQYQGHPAFQPQIIINNANTNTNMAYAVATAPRRSSIGLYALIMAIISWPAMCFPFMGIVISSTAIFLGICGLLNSFFEHGSGAISSIGAIIFAAVPFVICLGSLLSIGFALV